MTIVFTLCSNNYLAQAKALGDSLIKYNPEYLFIIGLVDKFNEVVDYTFFKPYEIIPIEEIGIEGFEEMFKKYNITELNTAVKPYLFNHLFKRNEAVSSIIYLDPDILVYDKFTEIENSFLKYNIILTPHFFTPIYDDCHLSEPDILNAGLYNLGFVAIKRSEDAKQLLNWWMIKLKNQCLIDFERGLFVDQLWINFVPLYFNNVLIMKHLGHNIAYWNFHEREVTNQEGKYFVNKRFPLVFFHFSGYLFTNPDIISKYQNRYSFEQKKDVLDLFQRYHTIVLNNNFNQFSVLGCYYVLLKQKLKAEQEEKNKVANTINLLKKKTRNIINAIKS